MLDDMMDVNSNPKNGGSPTFSMLSGHISHKTSMESINFSLGNDLDSISNSAALGKNRSRSSSTGKLDGKDIFVFLHANYICRHYEVFYDYKSFCVDCYSDLSTLSQEQQGAINVAETFKFKKSE